MYNSIKLSNQSSLNIKESREITNKLLILPRKIPPQATNPGKSLTTPLVLILTQHGVENSHLTGKVE